jgi:hypothetical protein
MVQLVIQASDGHGLLMILFRLDASFVMASHASFHFHWNSNRVLRPKSKNRWLVVLSRPVVLRPKPPNRWEKCIRYASP